MSTLAFLSEQGLMILAVVALVLFGGSKIPELMRSIGRGKREFESGLRGDDDELRKEREREAEVRRRVEEEMRKEGK